MTTLTDIVHNMDIVSGILPLDLQTARAGDYVSLKNYSACAIVFFKGAGTAGDDPILDLDQAKDVAGTSVKAASIIDLIYKKQGTLTAVGTFTKVTQTAADTFAADATSAEEEAIYVIIVDPAKLDVDNGFDCIRANIADVGGNAQLG